MDNREFHTVRGYQLLLQNNEQLTPALEDYLEMIYRSSLENGYLRINKLAELLNVKASSASKMVKKLGDLGLLNYEKYGIIVLSDSGREIGKFLLERHSTIEEFLRFIGCEEDVLVQTELIEHSINSSTLENIKILNSFFADNKEITDKFREYKNSMASSVQ
ncbi:DtxR family transcriptional regulator [Clostridium thermosuccinogenes]|uniref:Manganese transport regulator n=1 Tax=Clostridium thermosuccinogenes TaxID=84032 RepID=A0A2K2FBG9_9CLOT|nr:iron dependent repressor, metal binding and dimerization domain protein [Pseudoclostridium thermosuccinogenes]AUS97009.1 DtxR family transcriptional regulator [Pseudoclostridium thermosuccinogenes]PNT96117.1 DtxR family transcriptional regulator [Pseudoclostridium thermosuccinogenes]PNT97728.1 DtxR family transcriptional regulator [Pseudoclostridium thermosuccinogenes]